MTPSSTSVTYRDYLDQALLAKARALRETSLFSEGGDISADKQCIFLVLADCKAVSEVFTAHRVYVGNKSHTAPDDPEDVAEFLTKLGLVFRLSTFDDEAGRPAATRALVALDEKDLERFDSAAPYSHDIAGELFGFPTTAVRAFPGDSLPVTIDIEILNHAGLADCLPAFRFSQRDWQRELQTFAYWAALLRVYGLSQYTTP